MSITPAPMSGPEAEPSRANTSVPSVPTDDRKTAPLWAVIALAVVSVAGLGGGYYYANGLNTRLDQMNTELQASLNTQKEMLQQLGGRLDQGDERAAELQSQVGQTQERLGITQSEIQRTRQQTAAELEKQRQAAAQAAAQAARQAQQAQQMASQLGELAQGQDAVKGNLGSLSTDVAGVRGDVKSTQSELEKTKTELQRVIGDLGVQSDLVAHNGTELADLKARGERDYIEFDLLKKNGIQRVGTLRLELKRTDTRRQKYTLNLIVDDRTIEKKDKNVFEPVQFYQEGFRAPTEIVVNKIDKDRIVGYISVPKTKAERQPMGSKS